MSGSNIPSDPGTRTDEAGSDSLPPMSRLEEAPGRRPPDREDVPGPKGSGRPRNVSRTSRFVAGDEIFGRFIVVRMLGYGGMGEVWLVRHKQLHCDRALKFIDPRLMPRGLSTSHGWKRQPFGD